MKRKHKIIALSTIFLLLVIIYTGSYIYYRENLYLVHKKSWTGNENIHTIIRGKPNGHLVFAVVFANGGNEKDLERIARDIQRRIDRIYYFYYPCGIVEEVVWNIIDGKRT